MKSKRITAKATRYFAPGTLRIAYKLLVNDKGKFAALLMGLTFSVFLMVQMTSMFAGMMK